MQPEKTHLALDPPPYVTSTCGHATALPQAQ
jgi:hypothetical protein